MKNISLKNIFSLKTGQLLIIGLLSLSACKDEPTRLAGNVLPEGEIIIGLNYDEHQIMGQNVGRDAVLTSDADYGLFGAFNDSVFGLSKAEFVTDFSIGARVAIRSIITNGVYTDGEDGIYSDTVTWGKFNNNDPKYDDVWRVDSVVLNLQYQFNDWYGDMFNEQKLSVYEVSSSLGSNSTEYYSNSDVPVLSMPIGEKMVHPNDDVPDSLKNKTDDRWTNPKTLWQYPDSLLSYPQYLWDVVRIDSSMNDWDGGSYSAHTNRTKYWNIKLNDDVANRFFNIDSVSLLSTNGFQGHFSGVLVTPESNTSEVGSLTRINLFGSTTVLASHITLHYSREYKYVNSESELRDTLMNGFYNFPINVENVRFNRYQHLPDERIKFNDESSQSLYIQGMAGVYSKFSFPEEVRHWADSLSLIAANKLEGEPYRTASNIEILLEVDTLSYPSDEGGIQRYPTPSSLTILWEGDDGKLTTPIYNTVVNGQSISSPIFGSDASSTGSRSGVGEQVVRQVENEDGTYRYEYLYRFILRADYFNYIMRTLDETRYEQDLSEEEFLEEFRRVFKNEFYIGPTSTTADFRRVKLFNGSHKKKPIKMNIKYYHYQPR